MFKKSIASKLLSIFLLKTSNSLVLIAPKISEFTEHLPHDIAIEFSKEDQIIKKSFACLTTHRFKGKCILKKISFKIAQIFINKTLKAKIQT